MVTDASSERVRLTTVPSMRCLLGRGCALLRHLVAGDHVSPLCLRPSHFPPPPSLNECPQPILPRFVNKTVLSVYGFPSFTFLAASQAAFTVVVLNLLHCLGKVPTYLPGDKELVPVTVHAHIGWSSDLPALADSTCACSWCR